ncbi:SDR family NAD(P)-dependent oxidoreductase [Halalkalibacter akibai]|uniref:3-oxoacyl-[acyl-carrier protein] reductase n=1 Tax=Halalkalibacter akibai (strain ATCC 43226 / DSM 21942 / CIP 109018 / JCM 9157 / 1139) TaxID=1236973 RepID=W4QPV0_HALA3|nr:SDR family oxidoreductase [Halalkalibacter akibai]GAE33374.1 3-oxoacyl-[acyl-carrier protein] reductase [Halalkalibacter akibai JCM 9157]
MPKVALVTGGSSGIGLATVRRLAADGMEIVIADVNEKGHNLVEQLHKDGIKASFQHCDVSVEEAVKQTVEEVKKQYGQLHVLINNAGVGNREIKLTDLPVLEWQKVIDINLTGVFLGMKYAIPLIEESGGGAIVNVSSLLGFKGKKLMSAYNASKAGVITLTKNAALEYGKHNIRVNAVAPGVIDTPIVDGWKEQEQKWEVLSRANALRRVGTPTEVANAIRFLVSEEASYITGTTLMVDGGGLTY